MFEFYWRFKYKKIRKKYREMLDGHELDTNEIDRKLAKFAETLYYFYKSSFFENKKFINKFGFGASILYNVGGHTACLCSLVDSLYSINQDKIPLFLSSRKKSYSIAALTMHKLEERMVPDGIDYDEIFYIIDVISLYNKIVSNLPEYLFVFIHPGDLVFSLVLFLLKKNTPVKLIFFNHASHYPCLGMSFSHFIWEPLPSTLRITRDFRHIIVKSRVMGLPSGKKENYESNNKEEILRIRSELGLKAENFLTMSGGASYKFFNGACSEYFLMIRKILSKEPNLFHVVISDFSNEQIKIINDIFRNHYDLKGRLINIPLRPDFEPLFRSADVFIDSFPVSSALTQLDLMKNRIASVVKINVDNPEISFQEYLPKNYPYMFRTADEMVDAVLFLLNNLSERERVIDINYQHWIDNYESDVMTNKVLDLIGELKNEC